MNYKILLIVNPIAGKIKKNRYYNEIIGNLQEQGHEVQLRNTTKRNNASFIIRNYKKDYDIVIVCGGDGTLNETMQGLYDLNKSVQVGFIPFGTTNDYAKSIKSSFDKVHLSKYINSYVTKEIDLGLFNNRVFNYVASFGLFAKSSYNVSYKLKNKFGRLAYVFSGIKELFTYKSYNLKINYDDKEIDDCFIYGSISNSMYIGGFNLYKRSDVKLDDGLFEVLLVKKTKNIFHTIWLLLKVLTGHHEDKNIITFKTSNIKIEAMDDFAWTIDGEYEGATSNIEIRNLNKFSKFILPK